MKKGGGKQRKIAPGSLGRGLLAICLLLAICSARATAQFLICPAGCTLPNSGKHTFTLPADSTGINELSLEEVQNYRADLLPLSLAERGRPSFTSFRGMPPAFMDYYLDGFRLNSALWGVWDGQELPFGSLNHMRADAGGQAFNVKTASAGFSVKPVSRIVYSQDYQFGLSYLDAQITRFYRKNSYVRLGGANFLRNGSAAPQTRFQLTHYRVQWVHRLTAKWNAELRYYQFRHRANLAQGPFYTEVPKLHRVGQVGWLQLTHRPDSLRQFTIQPYLQKWGDGLRYQGQTLQRKSEDVALGLRAAWSQKKQWGNWQVSGEISRRQITEALIYGEEGDWEARLGGMVEFNRGKLRQKLTAGGLFVQDKGMAPELKWDAQLCFSPHWKISAVFSHSPKNIPLAVRYWEGAGITGLKNFDIPLRQSAEIGLSSRFGDWQGAVNVFAHRFLNAWELDGNDSLFQQRDYDAKGMSAKFAGRVWRMTFSNEAIYHLDADKNFAPQWQNILKIGTPLSLFKGALNLEGYGIYRFIGPFRQVRFAPLTNQFYLRTREIGNYHILDFKVLAQVQQATLFFVWENALSSDYRLVDDYWEYFVVFRLGINWKLFD